MNCPDCGMTLINDNACDCGWGTSEFVNQPETADVALAAEMRKMNLPPCFPERTDEAVKFWRQMNEPYDLRAETPRLIPIHGNRENSKRWVCPYNERLLYTLRKFIRLTQQEQDLVLAGINGDGVWWRGEEVSFYLDVTNEHHKMAQVGMVEYRKQAIAKMKQLRFE